MSFTIDFITERARQTHSVMLVMADTWVWSELSPAEFKAKCEAAGVKIETTSDKNAATIGSKGERDQMVKDLREQMAAGIQLARIKFRKDKEKLAVLRPLRAGVTSIRAVLAEALAWEKAWAEVDAAYEPEEGMTLANFRALRLACGTAQEEVATARAVRRGSAGARRAALEELWDLCVAWYATACIRFKPETPLGMTLRSKIPTKPRRKHRKTPPEPEPEPEA